MRLSLPWYLRARALAGVFLGLVLVSALGVRAEEGTGGSPAGGRVLTFEDRMRFRSIRGATTSEDGGLVAFEARPDRGDGEVRVLAADGSRSYAIPRGTGPRISRDGRFVAATVRPPVLEAAKKKGKDAPKDGLALLDAGSGETLAFDDVKSFALSRDSTWLARLHFPGAKEKAGDENGAGGAGPPGERGPPGEPESIPGSKPAETKPQWGKPRGERRGERPAGGKKAATRSEEKPAIEPAKEPASKKKPRQKSDAGRLVLRHLPTGREWHDDAVLAHSFDPESAALVLVLEVPPAPEPDDAGEENEEPASGGADEKPAEKKPDPEPRQVLARVDLAALAAAAGAEEGTGILEAPHLARLDDLEAASFTELTWVKERGRLAFLRADRPDAEEPDDASAEAAADEAADGQDAADDDEDADAPLHAELYAWDMADASPRLMVAADAAPEGWFLPAQNDLSFTRDGERLFFGVKPLDEVVEKPEETELDEESYFDPDAILEGRTLDVWHWDDPFIIPNQKKRWPREKDRTYRAVVHLASGRMVPLADRDVPDVTPSESPRVALASSQVPYRKEVTWDGRYADLYVVDLEDGSRTKVASRLFGSRSLAPGGGYAVFWRDGAYHLYDVAAGTTRNLTGALPVPFANEDHDYPSDPRGYGVAGWEEDDAAVYLYDKYDLWRFPTDGSAPVRVTAGDGRRRQVIYRVQRLDRDALFFEPGETLLLSAYHDRLKHRAFYRARIGEVGVEPLLEGSYRLDFVQKAEEADRILFTRQTYREFPDLWVGSTDLTSARKLSEVNPQAEEFAWGSARLVEWQSLDGIPLQGVLITPDGHRPGERLPVLVYFYRFMSQRLYDWNLVVINHRPCLPMYASHGYAVFLPDVRFEVGRPGFAATKCVVPGVQKLIEMGVADPDAVGLHGHSWSGYQTAFIITQTDLFAAAVAGAPVSNMTSAYSGIRLGSGLARQFQYEKSQSRIGGTLWNALDDYIENSPVFYADRIETPLLIMFGDVDDAVPWDQGVELYLAMRRLEKDCIFLQYRGEPHHPRKYANKLDYSIKMKEYLDHHLRGAPAPEWMTEGVPYRGF